jgi:hypothetical protein
MRNAITLLVILTFFSLSLSAQNPNQTSPTVPVNIEEKENVDVKSVSLVSNQNLNFSEQNDLLFAQNNFVKNNIPATGTQNSAKTVKVIPKVDLPKEPHNAFWQKLQLEPDELTDAEKQEFIDLLYDFYRAATILSQQLEDVGKPTRIRLEVPPITGINQIEDAEDLDLTMVLRRQIEQAKRLKREIETIEQPASNLKIEELQNHILDITRICDSTIYDLKKKLNSSQLNEMENENYKGLYFHSRAIVEQLRGQINNYTIPTISLYVGATTNIFYLNNNYSSLFAPSIGLNINPTPFLGIPDFMDIWVDYSNNIVKVEDDFQDYEHNLNNIAAGLNPHFSITKCFNIELFNWSLKAGGGYYWAVDKIYNSTISPNIWQGYVGRVETEINNLATRFPIGVYVSYSIMKIYKNLAVIDETNNLNFENKKFGTK